MLAPEPPVTYVESELHRRRRLLLAALAVLALFLLIGLVAVAFGLVAAKRLTVNRTEAYPDIIAHFERAGDRPHEPRVRGNSFAFCSRLDPGLQRLRQTQRDAPGRLLAGRAPPGADRAGGGQPVLVDPGWSRADPLCGQ